MFVQTEATPNPDTMKFIPGVEILPNHKSIEFRTAQDAERISPLAILLFDIPGVSVVFFGHDFISVSLLDASSWVDTRPIILGRIMDHFMAKDPVFFADAELNVADNTPQEVFDEEDADIVHEIKELLDVRVRPAVAQDGGDIVFQGFKDGVVFLHMKGACSGCPSSTMTLKHGIENMLRHYVPEVVAVEAV